MSRDNDLMMYLCKVVNPISLFSGVIGLTDPQYKRRIHTGSLRPLGDGLYDIIGQVNFKAGEIISLEQFVKSPNLELVAQSVIEPPEAEEEIELTAEMSRPEIMAGLDILEILYSKRAKKEELLRLLEAHNDQD